MFYKLCWFIIVLSVIGSTLNFYPVETVNEGSLPWAISCAIIAFLGLIYQAKRDLHDVCVFTTIACGIFCSIFGVMFLGGVSALSTMLYVLAGFSFIILVVSITYLICCRFQKDEIPNFLTENFKRDIIHESEGVQFVLLSQLQEVNAGDKIELELHMQNCFDSEREVCLMIAPNRRNRKYMGYPSESNFTLSAGSKLSKTIIIKTFETTRKRSFKYRLTASIKVKGSNGKRLIKWHAKSYTPPVTGGSQLIALLFGFFVFGGGFSINGKIINKNRQ